MTSSKSYARAYLAATVAVPALERLAWLMALRDRAAQRAVIRILQARDADAALVALDVPAPVIRFFHVLAEDRALARLGAIAEQALTLAAQAGVGVPVRLTTVEEVPADFSTDISQALAQVADGPVIVDTHVDPRVLGGFRVELGDVRLDRTLAGRLAALKRTLASA